MIDIGTIVMATLGQTGEGADRLSFGKLREGEFYRVSGRVLGNGGELKTVKLAGIPEYWPAELFAPVPADVIENLRAKVAELDELGEGQVVAKSVRQVLEAL